MSWQKPKKLLPRVPAKMDWQDEIRDMLIEAGTDGLKQNIIIKRFDHWIQAEEIIAELEALEAHLKVQRFRVGKRGRPATIWRATTEILKPLV